MFSFITGIGSGCTPGNTATIYTITWGDPTMTWIVAVSVTWAQDWMSDSCTICEKLPMLKLGEIFRVLTGWWYAALWVKRTFLCGTPMDKIRYPLFCTLYFHTPITGVARKKWTSLR